MAFSANSNNSSSVSTKVWGIAPVNVVAVNPNKDKLEEMGINVQEEPSYLGESEKDGKITKYAQLSIWVKPIESYGIDQLFKVSMFIRNQSWLNSDGTKCQVMDNYGRSAWISIADLKSQKQPLWPSGEPKIAKPFHCARSGEEAATLFLRSFLAVFDPTKFDANQNKFVEKKGQELEAAEGYIENIEKIFDGDFSPIIDAINLKPNNTVWMCFGIRHSDDGKLYQSVSPNWFFKYFTKKDGSDNIVSAQKYFTKQIQGTIDYAEKSGRAVTEEFSSEPLSEYAPEETSFEDGAQPIDVDLDNPQAVVTAVQEAKIAQSEEDPTNLGLPF